LLLSPDHRVCQDTAGAVSIEELRGHDGGREDSCPEEACDPGQVRIIPTQ